MKKYSKIEPLNHIFKNVASLYYDVEKDTNNCK